MELSVPEGSYDLRLWTDYARADAPLTDLHYHTESLRAVSIVTAPYTADADAKDAACYYEENFSLSAAGKEMPVQLQRPLAKLRLVASDAEDYHRLTATDPQNYPPLEELTLTVQYEGFFPSELNVGSGQVTDAVTGVACSTAVTEGVETDGLTLFTEWVLTEDESSVSATLTLSDRNGRPVCNVSRVKIDYRKGHLTTLRGRFLTAGVSSGGITIDTEWEEIIIPF